MGFSSVERFLTEFALLKKQLIKLLICEVKFLKIGKLSQSLF